MTFHEETYPFKSYQPHPTVSTNEVPLPIIPISQYEFLDNLPTSSPTATLNPPIRPFNSTDIHFATNRISCHSAAQNSEATLVPNQNPNPPRQSNGLKGNQLG